MWEAFDTEMGKDGANIEPDTALASRVDGLEATMDDVTAKVKHIGTSVAELNALLHNALTTGFRPSALEQDQRWVNISPVAAASA